MSVETNEPKPIWKSRKFLTTLMSVAVMVIGHLAGEGAGQLANGIAAALMTYVLAHTAAKASWRANKDK